MTRGDRSPAARRHLLPAKTLLEIVEHLDQDLVAVPIDVLAPQRLLELSIVDGSNVEQ